MASAPLCQIGHLRVQRTFHQRLGELLEQPVLADQVLGLLVIGAQSGDGGQCRSEATQVG